MNQNTSKPDSSKTNSAVGHRTIKKSAFTTSLRDRPLVFNSQHVDDLGGKYSKKYTNNRRILKLDEGSLQMTNDPNSIFYRILSETLQNKTSTDAREAEEMEKLKLFEKFRPELVEFLTDKEGHLKTKFDKVFII